LRQIHASFAQGVLDATVAQFCEGPIMRQQFGTTMCSKAIVSELSPDPMRENLKNNST
jgi:hypothetical protein